MPGLPYPLPPVPVKAPIKRKGRLLIKMASVLVLVSLLPVLLVVIAYFEDLNPSTVTLVEILLLFLFVTTVGVFLLRRFLKPLSRLLEESSELIKGSFNRRLDIQSGDEFETLAETLNQASYSLNQTAVSQKNLASAEATELNIVFSSISEGVIVLDLDFNVIMMNKTAELITAMTLAEIKGQPLDALIKITDGKNEQVSAKEYCPKYTAGAVAPPQTLSPAKIINHQQEEVQAEIIVAPVSGEIQTNIGYVIIVHDLTQKKNLEQMQIDFVSMASHEIRTPLTSIISYLSTISEESQGKLDPELKVFLDRALTSAQQLAALTANLLNVSKIERGSFAMFLQPLDWQKRLGEIVENLRPQAMQKNITLTLTLPSQPLPQVLADNIRINEVINNLISNAVNYAPHNGKIEVTAKVLDKEVITSVADNGPGVPKEAMPHLFTKFFRAAGSLEQMQKGTGLGLYLSKSIMDLHHGRIWVESEPGKGATFSFALHIAGSAGDQPTIAQLLH